MSEARGDCGVVVRVRGEGCEEGKGWRGALRTAVDGAEVDGCEHARRQLLRRRQRAARGRRGPVRHQPAHLRCCGCVACRRRHRELAHGAHYCRRGAAVRAAREREEVACAAKRNPPYERAFITLKAVNCCEAASRSIVLCASRVRPSKCVPNGPCTHRRRRCGAGSPKASTLGRGRSPPRDRGTCTKNASQQKRQEVCHQ